MLQAFIKDEADIPEGLKEFYVQDEEKDGWSLEVDLDSQKEIKGKIREFRNHNIELQKKLQEFEDQMKPYKDLDLDEIKAAMEAQKKVKEAEFLPREEVEKHIATRVDAERQKYEQEMETAKQMAEQAQIKLDTMLIEQQVTDALNLVGQVQKGALGDVLRRAKLEIEIKDGKLLERESGLTCNPKEWAIKLAKECPFFFVPNSGLNARGSGTTEIEKNPWKSDSLNLTEQGRLYKEDPAKARRLASEAGVAI